MADLGLERCHSKATLMPMLRLRAGKTSPEMSLCLRLFQALNS
jgi:hypothetical protein